MNKLFGMAVVAMSLCACNGTSQWALQNALGGTVDPSSSEGTGDVVESSPDAPKKDSVEALPAAGMKDAPTEAAMIKAVVEHGAEGQPLEAVILSDEWSTERTDLGIIRGRSVNGAVSLKRTDGTCYYVSAIFKQSYDGSDYGKLRVATGWGENEAGVMEELKCPN